MSAFKACLAEVLTVEKGFVDNPLDRGGPTNLGVTIRTLSAYLGRPATVDEIKALTPATVEPIYRKLYWDIAKLDEFPDALSAVLFNQVVLRGDRNAIAALQTALKVKSDGIVGPNTIAAAKAVQTDTLIFDFLRESHTAYVKICQADPSQLAFLGGWSNRIFDLLARTFR